MQLTMVTSIAVAAETSMIEITTIFTVKRVKDVQI